MNYLFTPAFALAPYSFLNYSCMQDSNHIPYYERASFTCKPSKQGFHKSISLTKKPTPVLE